MVTASTPAPTEERGPESCQADFKRWVRARAARQPTVRLLARPERGASHAAPRRAPAHHLARWVDVEGLTERPAESAQIHHAALPPEKCVELAACRPALAHHLARRVDGRRCAE